MIFVERGNWIVKSEHDNEGIFIGEKQTQTTPLEFTNFQGDCQMKLPVSGLPGVGREFNVMEDNMIISRKIGRDRKISLSAKGLYYCIKSYVKTNEFKIPKNFFKCMCVEGDRAFDRAWKELKDSGYLKVNGKSNYELL